MTEKYSLYSSSGKFYIGSLGESMRRDLRTQLSKWVFADPGRLAYDMNLGRERMLCVPLASYAEQMLWACHALGQKDVRDVSVHDSLVILPTELMNADEADIERGTIRSDRVLDVEVTAIGFSTALLRISNENGLLYSAELTRK